jgi:hypothetical protein
MTSLTPSAIAEAIWTSCWTVRGVVPVFLAVSSEERRNDFAVLPRSVALRLHRRRIQGLVDFLCASPEGEAGVIGGTPIPYRYAPVALRLTDGYEECAWEAIVGFVAAAMRLAVLGHAGALQFFDVQFLGDRLEAILTPTPSFPGRHTVHRPPP